MVKREEFYLSIAVFLSDVISVFIGFLLSYAFRFYSGFIPITKGIPSLKIYVFGSAIVAFVWIFIFGIKGLYNPRRWLPLREEIGKIGRGAIVGTLISLAFTFFYREPSYSRVVLVIACVLSFVLIAIGRTNLYRLYLSLLEKGIGTRRTAIVGSGEMAEVISKKLIQSPYLGYQLIGVVVEDVSKQSSVAGLRTLGTIDDIMALIESEKLEALIIALSIEYHKRLVDIAWQVEGRGVEMKFVPDLYELITWKVGFVDLEGIPLLGLRESPLEGWNRVMKRIFDILVSLLALIFLSPFFVLICILVKFTSKGQIFYKQSRIGKDGKQFMIYKFRSMIHNAEALSGPVWAKEDDPRITRFGNFLRKYNLDELPQLWNVLKGEMSLVGPRPERPFFVEEFRDVIPLYFERHRVKSGMTGWAQVNGLRGNTPVEERTRYDLFYVQNWSLGFDIWILICTIFEPLFRKKW